ncbi:MAG: hypothetical protein ABIR81_11590, partial [Ginsengibacter sp.]
RRFLSKEMRQLPRSDARKEAIKHDVRQCLLSSQTYSEFEALMKQKNYQVLKSRGIAFIDSKAVYVKGSALGYSLAKIDKILDLAQQQKEIVLTKPANNNFNQKQSIKSYETPDKTFDKEERTNTNSQMNKVVEDLLKPTHSNQNVPFELIKKRTKRKRSQHL